MMINLKRQSAVRIGSISDGPEVVYARWKKISIEMDFANGKSRDGPLIFHMRDGPPGVAGPSGGTGPPAMNTGSGPPQSTDPPMEWQIRKQTLKRFEAMRESLETKENLNTNNLNKVNKEENIMKTRNRNKLLCLALAGSCSLFGASNALAAAGDTIANRATLSYDVGAVNQTVIESGTGAGNSTPGVGSGSDTNFIEDRLINFDVVRGGATGTVVPGGTLQSVQYTLTNNGNGAQGFLLKGLNNPDGTADPFGGTNDEFDGSSVQTFVEDGTTPGFQPAEDTAAFVATLAAGASVDVYVVSTIPLVDSGANPLVNGNVAVMTLVAQAAINGSTGIAADAIVADDNGNTSPGGTGFTNGTANVTAGVAASIADDPSTEQTVFGDAAGTQDGTGAAGAASNAQHADDSSYTVQTAALTVTKASAALWDPVNLATNPKSIPGGYVRYTITIANGAGAANADLTTLSDVLAAALDLDPDFGDGTAANNPTNAVGDSVQITHVNNAVTNFCTGAADADGCTYAGGPGGTLSVDINAVMGAADAQLAAGESLTITFNVIVQ